MPDRPPSQSHLEKLLTYKQAGVVLGISDRQVWTLVNNDELVAVRFGGSVRIDPADLRDFIDQRKTAAKGVDHDAR
jgi:excisionase family DNA binding protein